MSSKQASPPPRITKDLFGETAAARERAAWATCPLCLRPISLTRWQYMGLVPVKCRWSSCRYEFQGDLRGDDLRHDDYHNDDLRGDDPQSHDRQSHDRQSKSDQPNE